jgi:hypothetical protein
MEMVEEARKGLKIWWKWHFGFSNTDERYLRATEADMLRDYAEYKVTKYMEEIGSKGALEDDVVGMITDPEYAQKLDKQYKEAFKKITILEGSY